MTAICGNYLCNRQQGSVRCALADWCPYYIAYTSVITSDSTSPLPKIDWAYVKTTELPKESECDAANVNGDQSDGGKAVMDCSYCPSVDGCLEAFSESTLCPNCGAKMRKREREETKCKE